VEAAVPDLIKGLRPDGFIEFAEAIMTTDTVPKVVSESGAIDGQRFTVTGIAKGAGMIRPDMATLLCFVLTDIGAAPPLLQEMLQQGVDQSFNRISIDGDTSTNDTALMLANGVSGSRMEHAAQQEVFREVLDDVLLCLAKDLVRDGEGASKLVEIVVKGANSDSDARLVAETVAHSNLLKAALFGEDANWGRILAAVGRAGVPVEPDRIDVFFADVLLVANGQSVGTAAETAAGSVLREAAFPIVIDLKQGSGRANMFTCDLSVDYVKINADYRS
jgi:glutamate N-acetyltransferase/amino-acid N-acetyltransferase